MDHNDPSHRQNTIFNAQLTAQLVSALFGSQRYIAVINVPPPIIHGVEGVESVEESERMEEEYTESTDSAEESIPSDPLPRVRPPSPTTDPPLGLRRVRPRSPSEVNQMVLSAKHARPNSPKEKEIDYRTIELNTCLTLYFTEEDGHALLLNERAEPNRFVRNVISRLPHGVKDRMIYLARFMRNDADYYADEENDAFDIEGKKKLLYNLRDQVVAAYIKEWRLRAVFRRVVHRLRIKKIDARSVEEVDPITLCAPEKPVTLYDWSAKKKFVFDAKSLATYIESKLLYNEGGFALPIYPSNPWTNVEFTSTQLISLYYQLAAQGELRWGLVTLHKYNFNKTLWHRYHHSALTMSAIKNSLIRLDSFDARELLLDFILSKVDELQFRSSNRLDQVYRIAIQKAPTHWYVEECKAIALIHYEAEHFGYNRVHTINQRCLKLFKKQKEFVKDMTDRGLL